ncbi:MAG: alkaline phosphatase family protein, partial [Pseudonocardia sp.]|nr:alkaline phosphatase family protein [Pseudonocardia sp.]
LSALTRRWALLRGVRPPSVSWTKISGPLFGNTIATMLVDGCAAEVLFEQPREDGVLTEAARLRLR